MNKIITNAPHDVMLVLDASTGQNAIEQAKQFSLVIILYIKLHNEFPFLN